MCFFIQDASEDQGTDTLNVLELVAKEDVDILPYMQYQSGKWRDTESRDMDSRLDLEVWHWFKFLLHFKY